MLGVDTLQRLVLTLAALGGVWVISLWSSNRTIHRVENLSEGYTDLYKQQHREVMDALQGETRKALSETKALVMEHTELERILRVLAARSAEEDAAEQGIRDEMSDLRAELRSHDVGPDK